MPQMGYDDDLTRQPHGDYSIFKNKVQRGTAISIHCGPLMRDKHIR
jgi:hypothetical protein